jgi:hypothetical protein
MESGLWSHSRLTVVVDSLRFQGKVRDGLLLMSQLDRSQSLVICDPLYCDVGTPVWIWAAEFSPVSFSTAFGRFVVSRD